MCGIFGSFNFEDYEKLYDENKQRGTFSYGGMYVKKTFNPGLSKDVYTRKRPGVVDLSVDESFVSEYDLFLGHTQAPTSAAREYSPHTSHPFDSIHYTVAHNGVLENKDELIEEFIGPHDNPVDSSIIPIILSYVVEFSDMIEDDKSPELLAIETVCTLLKGTFGCWIHSKLTGDTYIVRSGSTMYGDILKGNFSSTRVPGVANIELDEGVVYCVTSEGLAECGEFESNSPFFL